MINRNVKRVFVSLLAAGMLFGCAPTSAESGTGNETETVSNGSGDESTQSGFSGEEEVRETAADTAR